MEAASHPWPTLGVLLLRDGLVTKEDLESVLDDQRDSRRQRVSGSRLGDLLVDRGLVTRSQVAKLVAEQYELPFIELEETDIDVRIARRLNEDLARSFQALPISALPGGSYLVAIADPATVLFAEDLRNDLGAPLRFAVVPQDEMGPAIDRVYSSELDPESVEATDETHDELVVIADGAEEAESAPDVRFLGSSRTVAHLWPPLGALLVREALVSEEELDAALAQQRLSGGKRLGEILVERGSVTQTDIARLIAEQYELPFVYLAWPEVDTEAAALLPEEVARRLSALPIAVESDGALQVAIADPAAVLYSDELRTTLDRSLRFTVAAPDAIEKAIQQTHSHVQEVPEVTEMAREDVQEKVESDAMVTFEEDDAGKPWFQPIAAVEIAPPHDEVEEESEEALEDEPEATEPASVAEAVEVLVVDAPEVDEAIEQALELGATDIHFTPHPDEIAVRVRVEGALRELETLPPSRQAAISARLRLLAQLDESNTQAPQEGRIVFEHGEGATGLRVVMIPTAYGEKATLHVLKEFSLPTSLAELGMASELESAFREAIGRSSGLVLVCGPEGSGCSTTLYAALRELNTAEKALATIEDPVEQMVPGVDQVEVDAEAGLTYEAGLRAILLSDPDVVFVGELNDDATANGAMRAAVSGRLVVSRLHVATPAEASERLVELGLDRGAVSATLSCVVGQRLIRRICPDCREPYYPTADELAELDRPAEEVGRRLLARGAGCVACGGTGLRGRIAIFELLTVTDEIRDLVAQGESTDEVERAAASDQMPSFREEAIRLCLEGETTVAELRRLSGEGMEPQASWHHPDHALDENEDGASEQA